MAVMTTTTYIGIHKSDHDSAKLSVNENIKKARRTTYSLMGSGFHGRNGLDWETIISLIKTYVLPVLTYGLEIVLLSGKNMECLQMYLKKLLKQLLSLPNNVADISIYILSGTTSDWGRNTSKSAIFIRQYYTSQKILCIMEIGR